MVVSKLKSRRGMSVILGLLLLLVCAVAGAAALTSAASNAGRYTHMRRDQQRYLAVSSAARLVRDELCAGEYTAAAQLTETYTHSSSTNPETGEVTWHTRGPDYGLTALTAASGYTGSFAPWLEGHLGDLFQAGEVPADWWGKGGQTRPDAPETLRHENLALQVEDGGAEPILSQVKWTLEMGADYALTARFWVEETDGDGNPATYYVTTLTIPASVTTSQTMTSRDEGRISETTTTQTLTVTWPVAGAVIRQS